MGTRDLYTHGGLMGGLIVGYVGLEMLGVEHNLLKLLGGIAVAIPLRLLAEHLYDQGRNPTP